MIDRALGSLVLCVALGAAGASAQTRPGPDPQLQWVTAPSGRRFQAAVGRDVLVRAAAPERVEVVARRHGLNVTPVMVRAGIYRVRARSGVGALELTRTLEAEVTRGELLEVEPDYLLPHVLHQVRVPPDDPLYDGQWYFRSIGLEDAWRITTGSPDTTIVVVDNGCDLTHPDLAPKLLPGRDVYAGDDDPSFFPSASGNEHGTACAGLVGAATDNAMGIAGGCPECTVRCVRLLSGDGSLIPISADVAAFDFALTTGASVVSNSWGFTPGTATPSMLRAAINTFQRDARGGLGGVVVFAAGNDSSEIGPSELQAVAGVIGVGALNNFDEAASFSSFGDAVDVTCPTGSLTLDIQGADGQSPDEYSSLFGGTSSSAPIVAAIAALMISADPTIDGARVGEILTSTTRPAPFATPDAMGHDPLYGYGIVDPVAALRMITGDGPDAGVGPLDAGASLDAGVVRAPPPADDGCGCTAAGASPSPSGLGLELAALAILLALGARRARRRTAARAVGVGVSVALTFVALTGCERDVDATGSRSEALRPNTPGTMELPPRYDAADVVESIVSPGGRFRIHFTRLGRHAVTGTDADMSGTPDYVELVATSYDAVLTRYLAMGYLAPRSDEGVPVDNGGDDRFDVYLVDFGGTADGAFRRELCDAASGCAGYMLQENDFLRYAYPSQTYAVRLLASHEFFHAVQARYDSDRSVQGTVLAEGSAVWASEQFDDTLQDLEGFADAYFDRTDRSLGVDPIGAAQPFSYGSGVFFQFLSERFDADVVLHTWQRLQAMPSDPWLVALDQVLATDHASSLRAAFVEFARWNWQTGARADATTSYERGAGFPVVVETPAPLPFLDASIRVQATSVRYFRIEAPAGPVRVVVRATTGDAADVTAITAVEAASRVSSITEHAIADAFVVDPGDGDVEAILLALADGRTDGSSTVVSLCIENEAEDGCDTSAVDAGVATTDSGVAPTTDAGTTPPPPADEGGCGCSVPGTRRATTPALLALVAVAVFAVRRRLSRGTPSGL